MSRKPCAPGSIWTLQRRQDGGWLDRGETASDAGGAVTFEDTDVRPGTRYEYRVRGTVGAEAIVSGIAEASIPRVSLGISNAGTNPARGGRLALAFSLADDGPARLEVIDVSGRLIASQSVGSYGAGRHEISLDLGERLRSGIHFVRLTQSGHRVTTRLTVLE